MKQIHNFLVLLALAAIVSSCAPIYKCGDPVPLKQPGGKRMKALITERNELCTDLSQKVKDNESLKLNIQTLNQEKNNLNRNLNDLNKDYSDLQLRYKNLSDESLSQADQFSRTLQVKSEELENKEKLLLERERTLRELQQVIARQASITQRLNSVLRNALLGFNADDLTVEIKNGKVYVSMSDRLLFKSGSALVEAKGKEAIKLLADVLNNNPDIEILVEGHTDNIPIKTAIFKDNWDLSVVRATSIVRILTEDYKITPTRVTASGKGEFFPKASNDTPETRALNRRTEIILSPKLDEIMQLLNVNQN